MNLLKLLCVFLVASLMMLMYSCEDEFNSDDNLTNIDSEPYRGPSKDMYIFSSFEEYKQILAEFNDITDEKIERWEQKESFISLGSVCRQVYNTLQQDTFSSQKNMLKYVEENSKYFSIQEDETGAMIIEPLLYDYTESFFANKDGMYQVGDIVYKLFSEGKASCDVQYADILADIESPEVAKNIENITFSPNPRSDSYSYNIENQPKMGCGYHDDDTQVNGKLRVFIEIFYNFDFRDKKHYFNYLIKSHKKTWGAWILARRTLTYQIDARCDWMKYGQRYEKYVRISNTKVASKIEGDVFILDGSNYKYDFAFGAYKAWVTHPGVDYALVECNYSNF